MSRAFRVGAPLLAVGLAGLGAQALLLPEVASSTYGMPSAEPGWVGAAGLRDLALAAMTVGLLLKKPDAFRWWLPGLLLVPLGDVALVLLHGAGPLHTLPHLLGCGYIAGLWAVSPRDP